MNHTAQTSKFAKSRNAALRAAVKEAGSIRALARQLGITHAAIRKWDRAPAERVIEIERLTGVSRKRLRPDLYEGWQPSNPEHDDA